MQTHRTSRGLSLLVTAAILTTASACRGDRQGADSPPASGTRGDAAPSSTRDTTDPVRAFIAFATGAQATPGDAPLDAARLAEGLRMLAGALGALGAGGSELTVSLRASAEHVLLNPGSPDVAATTRAALVEAAAALDGLETVSADPVRAAAEQIRPDIALMEQPAALRVFFQRAADAMADAGATAPAGTRNAS